MFPCRRMFQVCVVGKVFKPNRVKVLALNRTLNDYFGLVKWYLRFNSRSKSFLQENRYAKAKELFDLNTALIQTVRDKVVEILKSFEKKEDSIFSKNDERSNPLVADAEPEQEGEDSLPIVFGDSEWSGNSRQLKWLNVTKSGTSTSL